MPTVQMVFRRSLRSVTSREAYLGGAAHPAAFAGTEINAARMVSLANADRRRRHPAAGAPRGARGGPRAAGRRLLRRRPLRAALRHPGRGRPGLALQGRPPLDPGLGRRDPRPERPRPRLRLAAPAGRPGEGRDRAARRRRRPRASPSTGTTPSRSPTTTRPSPRASTSGSSPRTACTTAPRRSSAGTARRTRRGRYAAGPRRRRAAARRDRPRRPGPHRGLRRPAAACRAPTGATTSPPTPPARVTGWTRHRAGRDPEAFTADGARILDRDAAGAPSRVEAVAYPLGRDAAGRLVVEELSTGAYLDYQAAPGP